MNDAVTAAPATATVTDPAVLALLHKVRKGATSSFTAKSWRTVFAALGWTVADERALVPATERDLRNWADRPFVETRVRSDSTTEFMIFEGGRRTLADLKAAFRQLTALVGVPMARSAGQPKLGAIEVSDVTEIVDGSSFPSFKARIEIVKKVLVVTAPDGASVVWNLGKPAYTIEPWLKAHGLVAAACAVLGIDSVEDEAKRAARKLMADERRATCPCCFRGIKYQPDYEDRADFDSPEHRAAARIVSHGYTQAPGRGEHVSPDCFGTGYAPFEVSTAGTRAYLARVQDQLAREEARLAVFDAGEVVMLFVQERAGRGFRAEVRNVSIDATDARWSQALAVQHENAKNNVKATRAHSWQLASYIANWTAQPLPQ